MNKVAMSFLTKDRVDLSERTIKPLLQPERFDLFCIDGSRTPTGEQFILDHGPEKNSFFNIRGGAGAALVFALTKMLEGPYEYVGLCEQDTLLPDDWFDPTFDLFARGRDVGLVVGSVSARCYADRQLFCCDGFSVLHNAGAGHVLFSRAAAEIVLNQFRSGWTTDNRRIFCQLSGVDFGPYWAFKNGDHPLTADWKWDADLAARGYASLALIPSNVEMIGQDPPLAEQGLVIAKEPLEQLRKPEQFERYRENLARIQHGDLQINVETQFQYNHEQGAYIYLPHQLHMIGGSFSGDWRFKEMRGFGEFGWVSGVVDPAFIEGVPDILPSFRVPLYGLASLTVSGGKTGGQIEVVDEESGYKVSPTMPPEGKDGQMLQIPLPASVSYRTIRVTALTPGVCFYRVSTHDKQPSLPNQKFDHSVLPLPV